MDTPKNKVFRVAWDPQGYFFLAHLYSPPSQNLAYGFCCTDSRRFPVKLCDSYGRLWFLFTLPAEVMLLGNVTLWISRLAAFLSLGAMIWFWRCMQILLWRNVSNKIRNFPSGQPVSFLVAAASRWNSWDAPKAYVLESDLSLCCELLGYIQLQNSI